MAKTPFEMATDEFLKRQRAGNTYSTDRSTFCHAWADGYKQAIEDERKKVRDAMAIYDEACKGAKS